MEKRKKTNRKQMVNRSIIVCFAMVLCGLMGLCFSLRVNAGDTIIRVGYINQCGFMEEKDGKCYGYGVDYLQELSKYTDWKYRYIYDSWENCLSKLEAGDLELICMAQYTEENAERFLYSDIPLGYEYTTVYAQKDSDIYYKDYTAMQGKRVGLLKGELYAAELSAFMEKNGLTLTPVYFETEQQVMEALRGGAVELAMVGSLHSHADLKIVDRFDVRAFYCITGMENVELMEELNRAMQLLKLAEPEIELELSEKYYQSAQVSSGPMFTRQEQEFIWKSDPIKVKLMADARPLSYEKDGELCGIFVRNLELLAEKSGLEFQIEMNSPRSEMDSQTEQMATEDYLMPRPKRAMGGLGMVGRLIASDPIMETQLSYVKRREGLIERGKDNYIFALTNELSYLPPMIFAKSDKYHIRYYDSAEACMEAVLHHEADIAIQDSYVITYLLQKPKYANSLAECPGETLTNEICLISSADNEMLIQIINKTIAYISQEEKSEAVTIEFLMNPYEQTLGDVLYSHLQSLMLIGVILIVSAGIYTLLLRRMMDLRIQKREYEILQQKVQQDELTGVYNRTCFYEKAREMIDGARESLCIVLMDIFNFKVVNELYGMENGDRLLRDMAQELLKIGEGREFLVARFNSDHFYMCMRKSDFETIDFPRRWKTFLTDMDITTCYGVFVIEEKMDMPVNLMCDRAYLAAHDMRWKRIEYIRYYNEEERNRIIREQEIENDMERALEEEQFCVYIQPKYDVSEETIVGGEALVRWIHPEKGFISPGSFISIFEKNGFIIRLDYFVWEETCRVLSELKKKGMQKHPVSVNVSRAHFYGKELKDKLEELVAKYQLKPADLELEITETICAEDPDIIYKKIRHLQDAGFKVAMDDFGSGYSSLNMLKEMPLDIIKMDLKFLDGGENIERSRNILRTLISLAQSMNLFVVVEGVETQEQVDFLKSVGNCHLQGYYFSKPVDENTYKEMLIQERMEYTDAEDNYSRRENNI